MSKTRIEQQSEKLPFLVLPDQVEEEAKIERVEFFKTTTPRLLLFWILTVCTAGFVWLLAKWKQNVRVFLKCTKTDHIDANCLLIYGLDGTHEDVEIKSRVFQLKKEKQSYRSFSYRLYDFYFDESDNIFKPIQFLIKDKTYEEVHKEMSQGITSGDLYDQRLLNYGKNSTDIPQRSNFEIMVDEILSPFYLFQLFAIIFWGFFDHYEIYAGFIFVISVITLGFSFYKIKENNKKLRERSYYETEIKVYRSLNPQQDQAQIDPKTVNSSELVPGDLIEIPNNKKMPCDVILLSGLCIMNESMLTGESVPVIKQLLPKSKKIFNAATADQYLLYSGTECLETRKGNSNSPVLGVVFRTGFSTMKGRLVRSFLYTKPESFKFYKDALKYIGAMAIIAVICFGFSCKTFLDQGEDISYLVEKSLDIITIAVPPALPTSVAIGASIACARLEKKKIITKSEHKINVAGRVKYMCFDKTGTLTKDSLDLYGVRTVSKKGNETTKFEHLATEKIHENLNSTNEKTLSHKMLELMATCHALTYVKGIVSGDPLDVKMFEGAAWKLIESDGESISEARLCFAKPPSGSNNGYYKETSEVSVIKRFEFSPKLQRMSVIVKDPQEGKQRVYVKGSPEVLLTLCKLETLPEKFNQVLYSYTQSGLRVIACATKTLDKDIHMNDIVERDGFEKDLEFIGFLVFENKMKEISPSIISMLKNADIKTAMLTGDNPLTAIFVARECGIVDSHHKVILGAMTSLDGDHHEKRFEWKYIDDTSNDETMIEERSPLPVVKQKQVGIEIVSVDKTQNQNLGKMSQIELQDCIKNGTSIVVVLTGEALHYLNSEPEFDASLRENVLKKAKVFARMKPDDKALIIEKLQKEGHIVGMCGDGANDCPSLKVANVGVALSEAEASLAAPFMSKIINISAIDILLREGRCALVSSFQCFKFMSMYSLIQTFSVVILYSRNSSMTDWSFLYQDMYIVIPIVFSMALTLPTDKLSKKLPLGSLLSFPVLTTMIGQCIIQAGAQIIALSFVKAQSWYVDPTTLTDNLIAETGDDESVAGDFDQTTLWLTGNVQYFACILAFSVGKPFRKPFYTNYILTIAVTISTITTFVLILIPLPSLFQNFFEIADYGDNQYFRWILFGIVTINAIVTITYERVIAPLIVVLAEKVFKRKFQDH